MLAASFDDAEKRIALGVRDRIKQVVGGLVVGGFAREAPEAYVVPSLYLPLRERLETHPCERGIKNGITPDV